MERNKKEKMDKQKLKKFAKEVSIPLILLVIYFLVFYVQKIIQIPSQDRLVDITLNFINNQSVGLIFLIAIFEGALILGQYAPGGVVIFLSFISAQGDILKLILLVLIVSVAFIIAYSIDYLLGYYGVNSLLRRFSLEKKMIKYQRLLEKNEFSTLFFGYWDTNLGSIVAVAFGSLRLAYKKFLIYSVICVIFWNIFWAVFLLLFGNVALQIFGYKYLLIVIVVWIIVIFYHNFLKKPENPNL